MKIPKQTVKLSFHAMHESISACQISLHAILINVVASSATELTFQHPILIYFMVKKPIFEA